MVRDNPDYLLALYILNEEERRRGLKSARKVARDMLELRAEETTELDRQWNRAYRNYLQQTEELVEKE